MDTGWRKDGEGSATMRWPTYRGPQRGMVAAGVGTKVGRSGGTGGVCGR